MKRALEDIDSSEPSSIEMRGAANLKRRALKSGRDRTLPLPSVSSTVNQPMSMKDTNLAVGAEEDDLELVNEPHVEGSLEQESSSTSSDEAAGPSRQQLHSSPSLPASPSPSASGNQPSLFDPLTSDDFVPRKYRCLQGRFLEPIVDADDASSDIVVQHLNQKPAASELEMRVKAVGERNTVNEDIVNLLKNPPITSHLASLVAKKDRLVEKLWFDLPEVEKMFAEARKKEDFTNSRQFAAERTFLKLGAEFLDKDHSGMLHEELEKTRRMLLEANFKIATLEQERDPDSTQRERDLRTEHSKHTEMIASLKAELSSTKEELQKLRAKSYRDQLTAQERRQHISDLEDEVDELEKDKERTRREHLVKLKAVRTQRDEALLDLHAAQEALDYNCQTAILAWVSQQDGLKHSHDALEKASEQLKQRANDLEADRTTQKKLISSLLVQNVVLRRLYRRLYRRHSEANRECTAAINEADSVKNSLSNTVAKYEKSEAELTRLKIGLSNARLPYETSTSEKQQLRVTMSGVNDTLRSNDGRLRDATEKYKTLGAHHRRLWKRYMDMSSSARSKIQGLGIVVEHLHSGLEQSAASLADARSLAVQGRRLSARLGRRILRITQQNRPVTRNNKKLLVQLAEYQRYLRSQGPISVFGPTQDHATLFTALVHADPQTGVSFGGGDILEVLECEAQSLDEEHISTVKYAVCGDKSAVWEICGRSVALKLFEEVYSGYMDFRVRVHHAGALWELDGRGSNTFRRWWRARESQIFLKDIAA